MKVSIKGGLALLLVLLTALWAAAEDRVTSQDLVTKGYIESSQDIEVSSRVAGVLATVGRQQGEDFKQGDLLLQVEDEKALARFRQSQALLQEAQAQLAKVERGERREDIIASAAAEREALANYNFADEELIRKERLLKAGAVTRYERDQAKEAYDVAVNRYQAARAQAEKISSGRRSEDLEIAKAAVSRVEADLAFLEAVIRDHRVVAPFAGVVAERLHEPGETVQSGSVILRIFSPTSLRVRVEIEETDVGKVAAGDRVSASSDAYPGRVFSGYVREVFPVIQRRRQRNFDPAASFDINTQGLFVELDDYSGLYKGMTLTLRFEK